MLEHCSCGLVVDCVCVCVCGGGGGGVWVCVCVCVCVRVCVCVGGGGGGVSAHVCVCVCVCVGVYCNSSVVFMGVCYTHAWVVYIISESQLEECSGMGVSGWD